MLIPAIDQNICSAWTQQQVDLYNKLPFYLMEAQAAGRKYWPTWKLLFNKIPWKPNQGDTMRRVGNEPTPVMRQQAFPERLNTTPLADVISYRERKVDAVLRWQDFVSPHFNFLPEFQDFMKHIDANMENMNKQMNVFEDVFYRTHMWHRAPYVYVAGVGLVEAPTGDGNAAGTSGKTDAWIQAQITSLFGATPGYLSFQELFKALNFFEQEVGGTPFEGPGTPNSDSAPLNERFALLGSSEVWNNFVSDPWLLENRPLNMDVVTGAFKGDLFGRIRFKHERYPMRAATDDDGVPTFHDPETTELNADREDYGRTKPNTSYSRPGTSQVEWAWLVGGKAADIIDSGPPPSEFTRDLDQGAGVKMNWNGKTYLTKEFLVPCKDVNGVTFYDANSWGRYIRAQGTLNVGMSAFNPQNVLPIMFKRRVGITTNS